MCRRWLQRWTATFKEPWRKLRRVSINTSQACRRVNSWNLRTARVLGSRFAKPNNKNIWSHLRSDCRRAGNCLGFGATGHDAFHNYVEHRNKDEVQRSGGEHAAENGGTYRDAACSSRTLS